MGLMMEREGKGNGNEVKGRTKGAMVALGRKDRNDNGVMGIGKKGEACRRELTKGY